MKMKKLIMGKSSTHRILYVLTSFLSFRRLIVLLQNTCPYVTSVGATQIKSGSTVDDPEVAAMVSLSEGFFSSGGGFSNIFPSDC